MPRAYSYIRFSSKKQERGDSVRRQLELAKSYCIQHDLTLDESLKIDDGISAYTGDNRHFGALNSFLHKIESGEIEKGSLLLIEALDRLSREGMWPAADLMRRIVNGGVDVVTLSDNKTYTANNISDIGTAFTMMIGFAVANEESAKKSKRTLATWVNKQKLATENKKPKTAMIPWWLGLDKEKDLFYLKDHEASIVKDIFEKYCEGYGRLRIAKYLNDTYETVQHANKKHPKMWYDSSVNHVLLNESVIGIHHYIDPISKEKKKIENYYPSAISFELWSASKAVRRSKQQTFTGGKQPLKNIFAHLIFCSDCGGPLMRASNTDKRRGTIFKFSCQNGRAGKTNCGCKGWLYEEVEDKLLKSLSEVNFSSIIGNNSDILTKLSEEILAHEQYIIDTDDQMKNISKAIARAPNVMILTDDLMALDQRKKELIEKVSSLKEKYSIENNKHKQATEAQKNIVNLKRILNTGINRQIANTELKKVIEKIILDISKKDYEIYYKNCNKKYSLKHGALLEIIPGAEDGVKLYFKNNVGIVRHDKDGNMLGIEMDDGNFGMLAYDKDGKPIGLNCNGVIVPYDMDFIHE
jgi:DNA invertase Pin-like site-specific DNA recombinase